MLSQMRHDLRELMELTAKTSAQDASLAAKPEIQPPQEYWLKREQDGRRIVDLTVKYELNF